MCCSLPPGLLIDWTLPFPIQHWFIWFSVTWLQISSIHLFNISHSIKQSLNCWLGLTSNTICITGLLLCPNTREEIAYWGIWALLRQRCSEDCATHTFCSSFTVGWSRDSVVDKCIYVLYVTLWITFLINLIS